MYGYLGWLEAYTPDLGPYSSSCDVTGTVLFTPAETVSVICAAPGAGQFVARAAILTAFDRDMGGPWRRDWEAAGGRTPAPGHSRAEEPRRQVEEAAARPMLTAAAPSARAVSAGRRRPRALGTGGSGPRNGRH